MSLCWKFNIPFKEIFMSLFIIYLTILVDHVSINSELFNSYMNNKHFQTLSIFFLALITMNFNHNSTYFEKVLSAFLVAILFHITTKIKV